MLQHPINMSSSRSNADAVVDKVTANNRREEDKTQRFEQALEKSMQDKRERQLSEQKAQSQQQAQADKQVQQRQNAEQQEQNVAPKKKSSEANSESDNNSKHSEASSKDAKGDKTGAAKSSKSEHPEESVKSDPKQDSSLAEKVVTETSEEAKHQLAQMTEQLDGGQSASEQEITDAPTTSNSKVPKNDSGSQTQVSNKDHEISNMLEQISSSSQQQEGDAEQPLEAQTSQTEAATAPAKQVQSDTQDVNLEIGASNSDESISTEDSQVAEQDKVQWLDMIMGLSANAESDAEGEGVEVKSTDKAVVSGTAQTLAVDVNESDKQDLTLEQQVAFLNSAGNRDSSEATNENKPQALKAEQVAALAEQNPDKQLDAQVVDEVLEPSKLNSISQILNNEITTTQNKTSVAEQKVQQLFNALNPAVMQAQANTEQAGKNLQANLDEFKLSETMFVKDGVEVSNKENTKTLEQQLASTLSANLTSATSGISAASDNSDKGAQVEVLGVQLDRTLVNAKVESSSQAKQELQIRENILFNKQELANNMQQQVGLMMARNMKSVDIRLDPPELGSMQIRLSVNNDQAAVSFVVSNPQAKDALEAALPRLREMLEQQGMQLADSDVKQENGQSTGEQGEGDEQGVKANDMNADAELEQQAEMLAQVPKSPWSVDYYA